MGIYNFTDAEVKVLLQLLRGDLSRLLLEIAHTDHREMREGLKRRESLLQEVIAKLGGEG